MKQNVTMMLKSKFSNAVHRILEPNIDIPARKRWSKKKELTDKEKLEKFDQIMALHKEASEELTFYQYDKRKKKRVAKARIERGVTPKKRTTKQSMNKCRQTLNKQRK